MQRDDSKLRVRRFRERQRAKKAALTVTPVTCNGGNGCKGAQAEKFAVFWREYPRKVAKLAAEKAWAHVAVSDRRAEEILDGLRTHLPELEARELRYRPHAATWLNQQRWLDPVEPPPDLRTARERREEALCADMASWSDEVPE